MTIGKAIEQGFGNGVNGLYDALKWLNDVPADASITVGATHTSAIAATIQLKDYLGNNLTTAGSVLMYLTSDAVGLDINTTALTTDVVIVTNGSLGILLANKAYLLVSEANGTIGIQLGYTTGALDFYAVLVMPNGKRIVSSKFEFSA